MTLELRKQINIIMIKVEQFYLKINRQERGK